MTGGPNEMEIDETPAPSEVTSDDMEVPAIALKNLWFSYEIAEKISREEKVTKTNLPQSNPEKRTWDGGLSMDAPRRQYDKGYEIGYKLQLKGVTMSLPVGARCLLLGVNGAGKSTLMACTGGQHLIEPEIVRVLGRPAFHDLSLQKDVCLVSGTWTQTIAFVGHNVPYQAMEVSRLVKSASEGVDPARIERLKTLLEIDEKWNLTYCSDGQRRRVQILCKLAKPRKVLLLDEITTDLDVLARKAILTFLNEESERGVTIVYCTHIFDGLGDWYTHAAYLKAGQLRFCTRSDDTASPLHGATLFPPIRSLFLKDLPHYAKLLSSVDTASEFQAPKDAAPSVHVKGLNWEYPHSNKGNVLRNVNFELPPGSRCLLVGANGSGKTTLLKILGGMHIYDNQGCVKTLGHDAFFDSTKLNAHMTLCSGSWTRQVACVGSVPFQADMSVEFMSKNLVDTLLAKGMPEDVIKPRLTRLMELLDLDPTWRLHKVSDGQRRRVQLLLKLLQPAKLLLLDEVTTDLDVLARQALLTFLREESQRGVTVIYATHIFDGLEDFATHVVRMRAGEVVGNATCDPPAELLTTVRGWLEHDVAQLKAAPKPAENMAPAPKPAPIRKAPVSKWDRFGSSSRHNAYYR